MTTPVELMGAPGSPYTRKMLAAMRYRHIPYRVEWQNVRGKQDSQHAVGRPRAKVGLLPTFYLPNAAGEIEAVTDSTPLIRRFEQEFAGRHIVPADPALAFINSLVEDYADEWLTKAMFHYRWHYQADIAKAASILPRWGNISAADEAVKPFSDMVASRQIDRLSYVGSNAVTKPLIEKSFQRFLEIFDTHLQNTPYLLGQRPASADFAIYGQLTCLALFDPTPQAIIVQQFPRIYAWTEIMEDLSGLPVSDDDWLAVADLPDSLLELMDEIGRLYLPYLHANARAVANGDEQLETMLDGQTWTQNPFTYQAKCLAWLSEEATSLDDQSLAQLHKWLGNSGVLDQLK